MSFESGIFIKPVLIIIETFDFDFQQYDLNFIIRRNCLPYLVEASEKKRGIKCNERNVKPHEIFDSRNDF